MQTFYEVRFYNKSTRNYYSKGFFTSLKSARFYVECEKLDWETQLKKGVAQWKIIKWYAPKEFYISKIIKTIEPE